MAVEKTGGPGVAGTGGVLDLGGGHGSNAVHFEALGNPSAVFADFHGGESAEFGEAFGVGGEVVAEAGEQGLDLVLVGEDDVDAVVELGKDPVASGADDLEGREVDADRATGGAGGGDHGVGEIAVEEQVALNVGMAASTKVERADFAGRE
jgi:hypothetical protein